MMKRKFSPRKRQLIDSLEAFFRDCKPDTGSRSVTMPVKDIRYELIVRGCGTSFPHSVASSWSLRDLNDALNGIVDEGKGRYVPGSYDQGYLQLEYYFVAPTQNDEGENAE